MKATQPRTLMIVYHDMKVNRLDVPVITPPMTPLDLEDSASVMVNDVLVDQSVNLNRFIQQ